MTIITELDVAGAIASGELGSPQVFHGAVLYLLRISGTGSAWRAKQNEYVWRDPALWLSQPRMRARWAGAPVVIDHPKSGQLDTGSFVRTVVGSVMFAFPRGPDLMCVARISDSEAAAAMAEGNYDTSPAVVFATDDVAPITLGNGDKLLVEREPCFVDHLAIVTRGKGVWTKPGGAPGVETELSEEEATA